MILFTEYGATPNSIGVIPYMNYKDNQFVEILVGAQECNCISTEGVQLTVSQFKEFVDKLVEIKENMV